ncbi:MAG TPA: isoprenylcysteine carboxylmethyltransferase family protein [Pelolinea sp.]|nr:isoprenylcysteine carboxylmethyltransferase family protein [Pelolinea sp.]
METHNKVKSGTLRNLYINTIIRNVIVYVFSSSIMFLAAGRLNWLDAIIFWIIYYLIGQIVGLYLIRMNSELMKERQDAIFKENVKSWDRWILTVNMILTTALFALIGIDAGRFGWSHVPLALRAAGGVMMLLSFGLTLWASHENTFMSSQVRIQTERGHRVVSSGPYAIIRHPMYAGSCLLNIGMPLLLNSYYGLLVNMLMIAIVVIRTWLEDDTLEKELDGYGEYAGRIRYRLFPGIW